MVLLLFFFFFLKRELHLGLTHEKCYLGILMWVLHSSLMVFTYIPSGNSRSWWDVGLGNHLVRIDLEVNKHLDFNTVTEE